METERARRPQVRYKMGALFIFLYFMDWLLTAWIFADGGHEANPFLVEVSLLGLLMLKVVVLPLIAGLLWAVYRLAPRAVPVYLTLLTGYFGGICLWNTNVLVNA